MSSDAKDDDKPRPSFSPEPVEPALPSRRSLAPASTSQDRASRRHSESETETPPAAPKRARKKARWGFRLINVLLAITIGLAITEVVFSMRDEGAFPHLNVYVPDDELGVRLEPGAEQKIAFGGNPVSSVRIHEAGFRGPDWPASSDDEIIVVGDSQVFGLGVEFEQTFSAKLAESTGRTVLNAGVPTYGPLEYNRTLEELLEKRSAKTVVYVVNIANDLFEAARPNPERHAVWDGWAVRKETAPLSITEFPGRRWLYRKSHAFFALRKLMYETRHPQIDDAAFASEGSWKDIVRNGDVVSEQYESSREDFEHLADLRRVEVRYAEERALQTELELEKRFYEELPNTLFDLRAARANPGDITAVGPGEAGSPLAGTVKQIRAAIEYRNRLESELTALADKAEADTKERIETSIAARDEARKALDDLRRAPIAIVQSSSPLASEIERAKAICDEHGAELLVVALPLDVQVSKEEWDKYEGQEPVDVEGTEILLTDIVEQAEALGAKGLNPIEKLREAQPGAFLNADLHMSPTGHEALADAIAERLERAEPAERVKRLPTSLPGLPEGRSHVPLPSDWSRRKEASVRGSTAANCETKILREWLRVRCTKRKLGPTPLGIRIVAGGGPDALISHWDDTMTLIVARQRGTDLVADFFWEGETRRLLAPWPESEVIGDEMTLSEHASELEPPARPPADHALCACYKETTEQDSCNGFLGVAHEPCAMTYEGDCERMIRCATGDAAYRPLCSDGSMNAGARQHCFSECEAEGCKSGTCMDWQGEQVCVDEPGTP